MKSHIFLEAMGQSDYVMSVIAITVCKVIQKLTKIDFWY